MVLVGIGYTGLGSTTQVLYLPLIPPNPYPMAPNPMGIKHYILHGIDINIIQYQTQGYNVVGPWEVSGW